MGDPVEALQKRPQNAVTGMELIKAPTPIRPRDAPVAPMPAPDPGLTVPPATEPGSVRKPWTFRNILKGRRAGRRQPQIQRNRRGRAYYILPQKRSGEPIPPGEQVRTKPAPPSAPGIPASSAAIRNLGGTSVRSAIEQAKQKYTALYGALSDGLYTQEIEVLGERVALSEEDYDFDSQKDIVSFTAAYFPEFAGDAQIEEAKVVFSKVFSPRGKFSLDSPLPPCSSDESKILLKGLRNRFETLRTDVLRRRDVYGDSIYTREGLEHVLRLKALVERLEDEDDCYDYDQDIAKKAEGRQLVIDEERLRNLVRQFVFMVLQSTNGLPEFKGKEVMDPVEFVEMLEKRSMSAQEMKDYIALQAGRNFKLPALFARILKLLEGDNSAVGIFLESELADLVEHVRRTIEGNLKHTDAKASKKLNPEFQAFVQTIQKRPAREQLYEMLVWILQAFTRAREDFEKTQSFLDTLQFKYGTAVKLAAETQDELNTLKGQYDALKTAYAKFKEENGSLQQKVNANFELASQTSQQAMSQEEAYKAQFKELQRRIAEHTLELQRVNSDKQKLEALLDKDRGNFKAAQDEVARLSGVLSKLELDLKAKTDDNSALVERVKELQVKLTEYERAAVAKVDTHETEIRSLKDQLVAAKNELAQRVGEYDAQIANYKTQLDALQRGVAGTGTADLIVKDLRERMDALTQQRIDLQRRLDACISDSTRRPVAPGQAIVPYGPTPPPANRIPQERAIVPYQGPSREIIDLSARLESITRQRDELQRQIEQLQQQPTARSTDVQSQLVAIQKKLDEITKERDELAKQRGLLDTELADTRKSLTDLTGQMAQLEKERQAQLEKLKELEAQLATKRPTFTQQYLAIEDISRDERTIQALRDDITAKDASLLELQKQVKQLVDDRDTGLRVAEEKRRGVQRQLEQQDAQIRQLTEQVSQLDQTKQALQTSQTDLSALRSQLEERERSITQMKTRITELEEGQASLQALKDERDALQLRIRTRDEELERARKELEDRQRTTTLLAIEDRPSQIELNEQKREEEELRNLKRQLEEEAAKHRAELEEIERRLKTETDSLEGQIAQKREELAERESQIQTYKKDLDAAIASRTISEEELKQSRAIVATLQQELITERAELEKATKEAEARLNTMKLQQEERAKEFQTALDEKQREIETRDARLRELEARLGETTAASQAAAEAARLRITDLEEQQRAELEKLKKTQLLLEDQKAAATDELTELRQRTELEIQKKNDELAEIQNRSKEMSMRLEEKDTTISRLKGDLDTFAKEQVALKEARDALAKDFEIATEQLRDLATVRETATRQTEQITQLSGRISDLTGQLTDTEEKTKDLTQKLSAAIEMMAQKEKDLEEQQKKFAAEGELAAAKAKEYQDRIATLEAEKTDLVSRQTTQLQELQKSIEAERTQMAESIQKQNDAIQAMRAKIAALTGVVEIAKRQHAAEVDELKRTHEIALTKITSDRDEVAAKLAGLQDTVKAREDALATAQAERDELRSAEEALRAEYKKQKDANSQQAITLQNQISAIQQKVTERDAAIQQLDAQRKDADAEREQLRKEQATLSAKLAERMAELQEKDATLASQAEQLEELTKLKEQRDTMTTQLTDLNEQLARQRGELAELRKTKLDEETAVDFTKERDELIAAINALEDTIGSVQTELQVKQTQIDELEKSVEGAQEEARARGETISKFQQRSKQLETELRQQRTGVLTKLQTLAEAIQMGADTKAVQDMFPGEEGAMFRDIYGRMQKREQALRKTIAENPKAAAASLPLASRDVCYLNYMITLCIKQLFFNHPDIRIRTNAFQTLNTVLDTFVSNNGGTGALASLIEECFKLLKAAESHFVAKQSKAGIPITNLTRGLYVLEGLSSQFLSTLYTFLKTVPQFSQLQNVLAMYLPIAFPNLGFTGTTLVFNPPPEETVDAALNGHPNFLYLQEPDVEREDAAVFQRYTKLDATGKETIVQLANPLVPSAFLEHGISYASLFACFLLLSRKYILSIEPLLNRYQCSVPQFLRDPTSVVPLFGRGSEARGRARVIEKTDSDVIETQEGGARRKRLETYSELGSDIYTELRTELDRLRTLEDRGTVPSKRALLVLRSQIKSYQTLSKTDTERSRAERLRRGFDALLDENDGTTLHGVSSLS